MKIENILVISDRQDKQQKALAHSQLMAERYGAKLHVVAFNYEHLASLSHSLNKTQILEAKDNILQTHQQWLSEKIKDQGLQDYATNEVVWEKDIATWVSQHCATKSYDLIIKTGNRSEGTFYVPTDWHLMRNGVVPVMLVADKKWHKKRTIMVSLDLATKVRTKQSLNKKLVDAAITLGAATGMPIHYCFCLPLSPVLKDLGLVNKRAAIEKASIKYLPLIHKMLGEQTVTAEQIHIKAGEASKVIPSVASKVFADLVIIGSVGRKGIKAKLMGNTAESILALLKTDVMVIQP
ncbi:universal stress protein [Paraglaciecola sp.]|uniref:universal stress protein n=1 Tax=Paraglaciecola sp. TaxID=1920173 RepID=UPI0030F3FB59